MMLKIRCFFVGIFFINSFLYCSNTFDHYYKTSFLKQYSQVRIELKSQGFREIYFKTPDGLRLNGLFLSRSNATCNVIVCAGWLPGRMESLATFFALLPDHCNILLFDARGHGKSEGPLLREVWRYGVNEYKDIIGGISCLMQINDLPIVICGICSGAFNAAHAIFALQHKGCLDRCRIQGLVFDSGWGSVTKMASSIVVSGAEKRLLGLFARLYRTKNYNALKQGLLYSCCLSFVRWSYGVFYSNILKRFVVSYENRTTLFNKIDRISCPIFFIHSRDDTYANFEETSQLVALSPHKEYWIVDKSYHAKHHLKQKDLYKEKLSSFIERVLQDE